MPIAVPGCAARQSGLGDIMSTTAVAVRGSSPGVTMDVIVNSLTESERATVRDTDAKALSALDEDGLLELHLRVRRARNKYVGQYRRQASARVSAAGGRGKARPQNQRARDKAEVFEAALARVSTALAKAARHSAAQLRTDRLAAARAAKSAGPARAAARTPAAGAARATTTSRRPPEKSSGRIKKDASSIAAGKRRQARRDAR
jgi:hypothetical protein